ncbi:MAG: haloacid dehalogenase-like hydrolase [archaeon]
MCDTSRTRSVVVLDFDNTCIVNDIGEAVLAYVCRHKFIARPRRQFLHYYALLSRGQHWHACAHASKILAGFSVRKVRAITRACIAEEGATLGKTTLFGKRICTGITVRASIRRLMHKMQKRGVPIWIVSATAQHIIDVAAKEFFSDVQLHTIGIRMKEKRGVLTKQLIRPVPIRSGKVTCIKHYIGKEKPLLAIGDSRGDLAMVSYAKKGMAIRGRSLDKLRIFPTFPA